MNTATDSQNSQQNIDEEKMADRIDIVDYMWEKEVERDLLLLLQTWNADRAVKEYRKKNKEALIDDVLPVYSKGFQQPVYFPFSGTPEYALGDAIAQAGGLLLIECKNIINTGAWNREAQPEVKASPASKGDKKSSSNKGGKNRLAQLTAVEKALDKQDAGRARRIANQCHVLIGAVPEEQHAGPSSLRFTWYWDFIMPNDTKKPIIKLKQLSELKQGTLSFADFHDYLFTMLEKRSKGETGNERLLNQLIVLVKRGDSWHGHRVTDKVLSAALENAVKVMQEAAEKAQRDAEIEVRRKAKLEQQNKSTTLAPKGKSGTHRI